MLKCDKVNSLGAGPTSKGYVYHIQLEEFGKIGVCNRLYMEINMGDVVSISENENGEYEVINIFRNIKGSSEFEILKTTYQSVELCEE